MSRVSLLLAGIFVACSVLAASAKDITMVAGPTVPAAQGSVSFEHDHNHNTKFTVKAKHLAQPQSLTPPANSYVVWVRQSGKEQQNVGALSVNENLDGSLTATTPYQAFDVIITAENAPTVGHPSGAEVLHATVSNK